MLEGIADDSSLVKFRKAEKAPERGWEGMFTILSHYIVNSSSCTISTVVWQNVSSRHTISGTKVASSRGVRQAQLPPSTASEVSGAPWNAEPPGTGRRCPAHGTVFAIYKNVGEGGALQVYS